MTIILWHYQISPTASNPMISICYSTLIVIYVVVVYIYITYIVVYSDI